MSSRSMLLGLGSTLEPVPRHFQVVLPGLALDGTRIPLREDIAPVPLPKPRALLLPQLVGVDLGTECSEHANETDPGQPLFGEYAEPAGRSERREGWPYRSGAAGATRCRVGSRRRAVWCRGRSCGDVVRPRLGRRADAGR